MRADRIAPKTTVSINKTTARWIPFVVVALVVFLIASIANDIEYLDQFNFAKNPFAVLNHTYDSEIGSLFPFFGRSVIPASIIQGQICDCKFLSTTAALISSEAGRRKVKTMIRQNADSTYTVRFPGVADGTVVVSQPTRQELFYSARTSDESGYYRFGGGIWLPVLEKAYGTYRNSHQPLDRALVRFVKHAILEGRLTAESKLPSFGAAYGAFDDEACRVYTGHGMTHLSTASWELGDFGFGKDHLSARQVCSWFDRDRILAEIYAEQRAALTQAFNNQKIVLATTEGGTDLERWGIKSHHAYAVLNYDDDSQLLTLRDPLGSSAETEFKPGPDADFADGKLDGQFQILLVDFNRIFSRLSVES